ncbi:hypothetical protein FJQ98_16620 [Lysinibacillus agricola]|uniref:RDRP core domain-containing protein n=2 Tax=Bacillaceae TaxID=186817 RepID=A0ABX7AYX9_9BACI|nr:hypothetical protein AN161_17815 [Lysinibacillus sp. FJAT-14222]QQP14999.1 hypothetical protein FJQ98_16620 [Lysinibacillus agricola]
MKFESDRLKKFNYDISINIDEAIDNKELIAVFENQLIDTILDITKRHIDVNRLKYLEKEIHKLKNSTSDDGNGEKLQDLQLKLNELIYVPEYITIEMSNKTQYKRLYSKGVLINGVKYKRFNSSASQARVNTVLFIAETVFDELRYRTDNGRNKIVPIAPAKLNAYRGLYGSSRYKVTTPNFCVVKDFESPTSFNVNFVTETDYSEDDEIEEKSITKMFNRFDGQGLISPKQAEKWAKELEIDYIPSQFCIRGSFLKGMLTVFDIHEWVEEFNEGNYIIESIYKDDSDNPMLVDLRCVDVIITESQLKLWDSWSSVDHYRQCCVENNMSWGISIYAPKYDKTFFYQNYQFLQTLNLDDNDVATITDKFVKWIKGVTSENVYYTMLFLVGMNANEEKFNQFLNSKNASWIKALIVEPKLIKDKYIRNKIYNMLKKKIQNASIGQIIVDGNFQVIVSDPFAMMEAVCGKEVKGLLAEDEHYSNYWNNLNIEEVVASRSPLTYRSEHVLLKLIKNDDTEKWYKYCYSGIILNAHGNETDRFAGSDFDYDIIATTSDKSVIKGVYRKELPVVYEAPKPSKVIPTENDLYNADTFSFNSIIGGLTNKSTSGYALLANLSPESEEYKVTLRRIKSITKAQSAQIDKTKIGQEVKGIVPKWVKYQLPIKDETEQERYERELNNRILLDKHPYFFMHLYSNTKKKYKDHVKKYEILSLQRLGITLTELKSVKRMNDEQLNFIDEFYRKSPVIESDCVMNKICKRIESVDFEIKKLLKLDEWFDDYESFMNKDIKFNQDTYKKVKKKYSEFNSMIRNEMNNTQVSVKTTYDESVAQDINIVRERLKVELLGVCNNEKELMNYVIHMICVDNKTSNKDIMWSLFGDEIVDNLKSNKDYLYLPIQDEDGEIEYLNKKYTVRKVELF